VILRLGIREASTFSDLDVVDRLEIKHLALDNFWRYIAKAEVPLEEPGHLSPVTVAKAIEYGVSLWSRFCDQDSSTKH
jgi:hypothetical protein